MTDEDKIIRLTRDLRDVEADIEALHSRIIMHRDRAAWEILDSLGDAAREMLDNIYQQDFMDIEEYEKIEREINAVRDPSAPKVEGQPSSTL
jgi:hypothetical protein